MDNTITEKTKLSLPFAFHFAIWFGIISVVSSFWIGYSKVEANNQQRFYIMMQKISEVSSKTEKDKAIQDQVNNSQAGTNSEMIDFRRRVEFKLGWR